MRGRTLQQSNTNQPGIKATEFVYDQNNASWSGAVQIATLTQLQQAQASDSGSMLMIWEDDNDACRIRKGQLNVQALITGAVAAAQSGRAFIKGDVVSGTLFAAGLATQLITLMGDLQSDDPVGMLVRAQQVGQFWVDATHGIIAANGQIAGRVNLVLVP